MTILSPDKLEGRSILSRRNYALKRGSSVDVLLLAPEKEDGEREIAVAGPVSEAATAEIMAIVADFTKRVAKAPATPVKPAKEGK